MTSPHSDRERFAVLVTLSAEAWLQSRAALLVANGDALDDAAEKARDAFERAYSNTGIDVSYFRLERK